MLLAPAKSWTVPVRGRFRPVSRISIVRDLCLDAPIRVLHDAGGRIILEGGDVRSFIGCQSIWARLLGPAACLVAGAIVVGGVAGAVGAFAPAQDEEMRCNPVAVRSVEPLVVAAGDSVDVNVEFDYACSDVERTIYFYLVVENSENLNPGGFSGREYFDNVRDGLNDFVEQIDYTNGSKGGLILYTNNESERLELRDGDGGKRALQSAVTGITTSGRSANAAGEAVELATEKLLEAEADGVVHRVIVIMDAGATMSAPRVEPLVACQAARDAGIQVAVISLRDTESRLAECAPEYLRHSAARPTGEDIPPELDELGDGMSRADQADLVSVFDQLESGFSYEVGSGTPRPPDVFFINELGWDFLPPAPEGGQALGYRLNVSEEAAGTIGMASMNPLVTINYADGSFSVIRLENPEICVHPRANPAFCEDFIATLTPSAMTATATSPPEETPTPTGLPPEETPTMETPTMTVPTVETPTMETPTEPVDPTPDEGDEALIFMPYGGAGR